MSEMGTFSDTAHVSEREFVFHSPLVDEGAFISHYTFILVQGGFMMFQFQWDFFFFSISNLCFWLMKSENLA